MSNARPKGAYSAQRPWSQVRNLCGLMANDLRRAILIELSSGPADVGSLAKRLGASMTWVSNNLKHLLEHDLVAVRQVSRRRIYQLSENVSATKGSQKLTLRLDTPDGSSLVIVAPVWHNGAGRRRSKKRK